MQFVDFDQNQIQVVPLEVLNNLPKSMILLLLKNPIRCDCDAIYLWNWLERSQTHNILYPTCATPVEYQNRTIDTANLSICETKVHFDTTTSFQSVSINVKTANQTGHVLFLPVIVAFILVVILISIVVLQQAE